MYDVYPQNPDAPPTIQERDAKLTKLADTIRQVFPGFLPDIIGLCELGSYAMGQRLAANLCSPQDVTRYASVWSGLGPHIPANRSSRTSLRYSTGIAVLFKSAIVERLRLPLRHSPNVQARAKWLAVPLRLTSVPDVEFWMVVNHWKSAVNITAEAMHTGQKSSAREIGELYQQLPIRPMLLIGDFNCEPFDPPFFAQDTTTLRVVRERQSVLTKKADGYKGAAYFYNPMWRLMGDADDYETTKTPGYILPRPPGSYLAPKRKTGWRMLDQLAVSRQFLDGGYIMLIEASVRIVPAVDECSDHCALGFEFQIEGGSQQS